MFFFDKSDENLDTFKSQAEAWKDAAGYSVPQGGPGPGVSFNDIPADTVAYRVRVMAPSEESWYRIVVGDPEQLPGVSGQNTVFVANEAGLTDHLQKKVIEIDGKEANQGTHAYEIQVVQETAIPSGAAEYSLNAGKIFEKNDPYFELYVRTYSETQAENIAQFIYDDSVMNDIFATVEYVQVSPDAGPAPYMITGVLIKENVITYKHQMMCYPPDNDNDAFLQELIAKAAAMEGYDLVDLSEYYMPDNSGGHLYNGIIDYSYENADVTVPGTDIHIEGDKPNTALQNAIDRARQQGKSRVDVRLVITSKNSTGDDTIRVPADTTVMMTTDVWTIDMRRGVYFGDFSQVVVENGGKLMVGPGLYKTDPTQYLEPGCVVAKQQDTNLWLVTRQSLINQGVTISSNALQEKETYKLGKNERPNHVYLHTNKKAANIWDITPMLEKINVVLNASGNTADVKQQASKTEEIDLAHTSTNIRIPITNSNWCVVGKVLIVKHSKNDTEIEKLHAEVKKDANGNYYADFDTTMGFSTFELDENSCTHATTEPIPEVPATCTTTGLIGGTKCKDCGVTIMAQTVVAALGHRMTATVAKDATCTEAGNTAYWTCDTCSKYFSDAEGKTETTLEQTVVEATGHAYGAVSYVWVAENKTCTAERTCSHDNSHQEIETVTPTQAVSPATCTETGKTVYSAKFENTAFTTQVKEVPIDALGHTYGEATYIWSADNATCTAERICGRDGSHKETETAASTNVVTPATCTVDGKTVYSAKFENTAFAAQTKDVIITADGHVEVTNPAVSATCTATGLTEGKHCSVCKEVLVVQEVIAKLSHDYVDNKCTCGAVKTTTPVGGNNVTTQVEPAVTTPAVSDIISNSEQKAVAEALADKVSRVEIPGAVVQQQEIADAIESLAQEKADNKTIEEITVTPQTTNTVKAVAINSSGKTISVTFDVDAVLKLVIKLVGESIPKLADVELSNITEPVPMELPAPAGWSDGTTVYVTHTKGNGMKYYHTTTVADGAVAFINCHGFSDFTLSLDDPTPKSSSSGFSYTPSGHLVTSTLKGVDKVYVDNQLVSSQYYTVSGGDIVLSQRFLNSLKAGAHSVKLVYGNRQATGTFSVKGSTLVQSAKTFDAGIALYAGMAMSSALGAAYVLRKKKEN